MSKPKKIVSRAANVQTHMTGNAHFPDPPVDLAALKTAIDTLSALIAVRPETHAQLT